MRFLGSAMMASALLVGGAALLATPASADDDIYFNHAKGTMSGAAPSTTAPQATTARQPYITMDPRDAKASASNNVDANNPYFNHAEGTMSADSNANYAAPSADQNSRYTASYQNYMQVDPRDSKVDPNAGHDVDGSNIYFNHAKGTMSGN